MRYRPDTSISERELVLALAAGGRHVALSRLVNWRKEGLLPPLASSGVGNGRSYYWREPNILAQAELVHDCLARHGRSDATIITLWLKGFWIPLPQLRRAWQNRARLRKELASKRDLGSRRLARGQSSLALEKSDEDDPAAGGAH